MGRESLGIAEDAARRLNPEESCGAQTMVPKEARD